MNSKELKLFSDHFNIDKSKLNELGVFDSILNIDTRIFVEPLLLKNSSSPIIKNSYNNYKKYFSDLLILLHNVKKYDNSDKCWRAAQKMINFHEYQDTCIGYGSCSTQGRGSGIEFNDKILQSAKEITELAKGNSEIFLLLPLLEDGIAGDRISDMTQNIIDDDISLYTEDIMHKLNIKGNITYTSKKLNKYSLLQNPYSNRPIKLLPKDILSNLPIANNLDTFIEDITESNTVLRGIVNRDIGNIWIDTTKAYRKNILLQELKSNKEFFIETVKILKEHKIEHYDLDIDKEGMYRWLSDSYSFVNIELSKETIFCSDNLNAISCAVKSIIHHFKNMIEEQEIWRIFWTKHNIEYKHVKTYYSQMLFFTVCNT